MTGSDESGEDRIHSELGSDQSRTVQYSTVQYSTVSWSFFFLEWRFRHFVITQFNNIVSTFRDWFRWNKKTEFTQTCQWLVKYRTVKVFFQRFQQFVITHLFRCFMAGSDKPRWGRIHSKLASDLWSTVRFQNSWNIYIYIFFLSFWNFVITDFIIPFFGLSWLVLMNRDEPMRLLVRFLPPFCYCAGEPQLIQIVFHWMSLFIGAQFCV